MPHNTLYQISGEIDNDIRQSYTGGSVDVYIPHNFVYNKDKSGTFISGVLHNIKGFFIRDIIFIFIFIIYKTFLLLFFLLIFILYIYFKNIFLFIISLIKPILTIFNIY